MIENLKIGDSALLTKSFSSDEVKEFAQLSLDDNPIHLDKDFATASMFGQCIVHGMLVASLFSGLLGKKLPGPGCIYLGQKLNFKAPVMIGEDVTASVELIDIRTDKPIVTLKTTCTNRAGKTVLDGEAVVMVPK